MGGAGSRIVLAEVSKSFRTREGGGVRALDGVSLEVAAGEIAGIVGPTGCGKSTLLRIVAGLERPDVGAVETGCGEGSPGRPALALLAQGHSLFPWLTAEENIALPLRLRGEAPGAARARCREIAAALGLADSLARYPYELSGGMQQRAAMGRLLASDAACWLLDEPFASLDERTRHRLQDLLAELAASRGLTVLLVTHSVDEAVYLADRVHVLSAGPGRMVASRAVPEPRPRDRLSESYGGHLEGIRRRLEEAIR